MSGALDLAEWRPGAGFEDSYHPIVAAKDCQVLAIRGKGDRLGFSRMSPAHRAESGDRPDREQIAD
jgi:hypothetical protein